MCFRYFKDKSKLRWIVCGFIDNEIKALNHSLLKLSHQLFLLIFAELT